MSSSDLPWGYGRGHDVGCEWTKDVDEIDMTKPCRCENRRWLQLDMDSSRHIRAEREAAKRRCICPTDAEGMTHRDAHCPVVH